MNSRSTASDSSPTLSEAENDLEQQLLTSITEDNPFKWDEVVSKAHPQRDNAYGPPPALPRKSSKRKSCVSDNSRHSRLPSIHITSALQRRNSRRGSLPAVRTSSKSDKGKAKMLTITIPPMERRMSDDFTLSPLPEPGSLAGRNISPQVAEGVILSILQSLESLDDLFATAVVNKGFYRVFKRHELSLMRGALKKMSPPAWEHREICPPGYNDKEPDTARPNRDYTPTTYLQHYMRDMYIIAALKSLIIDQCQSFLRPETAAALSSDDQVESSRVDDAFWRIWTFCKIFGCGKGREDDIVAQMDWLKGGALVHQKACRSTILTTDSFDITGAFASAPDCFAKGNENGLSAEQLYDMTELWTCLGVLLQGFEGRIEQARQHGLYEHTNILGGDIDGEEVLLDEWYHYLLTLGLSTILDLAASSKSPDTSAFRVAAENGWMKWKVPEHGGSRKTFLKEAVSRVYEEKIASSFASSSQREVMRQMSKQRIQNHITEIRERKKNREYKEVRMSQERPMSEWEGVIRTLTTTKPGKHAPPIPPMRYPPPTIALPPIPVAKNRTVAMPVLPSPPIEEHPAFLQHPLQRDIFQSDAAENTADKAIYRIVEMGFTADQARQALRMTDMGDGLRVDRAVELLLRA
ncbi:hypothetical protein AOQ84DRAFT_329475 [Glonium stellatum]|uniref:UBA domain-containing protein n=1 Tax=Glonium stellatum TaxID=574774 RepID=A0A8E2FEC9_9PEZI|nr:hypothetical protein AOQ84DRAFT_329475 [Glonium stellatum]